MRPVDGSDGPATGGYRDLLAAATARIEALERQNKRLSDENQDLVTRLMAHGPLAGAALPAEVRRRWLQRRVRRLRRDLRVTLGVRRYAASAIVAVSAAAAFVIMAAESLASWPLAIAILCMGAVARSLVSQWPGFDEIETRRRKLEALQHELEQIRRERRDARIARGARVTPLQA